jgi:hypothetical protein
MKVGKKDRGITVKKFATSSIPSNAIITQSGIDITTQSGVTLVTNQP